MASMYDAGGASIIHGDTQKPDRRWMSTLASARDIAPIFVFLFVCVSVGHRSRARVGDTSRESTCWVCFFCVVVPVTRTDTSSGVTSTIILPIGFAICNVERVSVCRLAANDAYVHM